MKDFDSKRQIAIIWSIDDVQEIRPDLSDAEAMKVLKEVERKHDADMGITWMTLEITADELYPSMKEDD